MAFGAPPANCTFTSEEAYTYYSDWPTMLQNGWLDAAIPMNYKVEFSQSFRDWCDRAYSCWRYSRHIYMGLGAYLTGNSKADVVTQLQYVFASGLNGHQGRNRPLRASNTYKGRSGWTRFQSSLTAVGRHTPREF